MIKRAIRTRNILQVVHRVRFSHTDKFGFALTRRYAKFTGDRSTSNGKWARVPRDEVNSASSRRRRNHRKTSAVRRRGMKKAAWLATLFAGFASWAKTLINVFCTVFTVLEYHAGDSLKATSI